MRAFWGIVVLAVMTALSTAEAQIQAPKPLLLLKTPFIADEFEWSQGQGTGVISGQASLVAQCQSTGCIEGSGWKAGAGYRCQRELIR